MRTRGCTLSDSSVAFVIGLCWGFFTGARRMACGVDKEGAPLGRVESMASLRDGAVIGVGVH